MAAKRLDITGAEYRHRVREQQKARFKRHQEKMKSDGFKMTSVFMSEGLRSEIDRIMKTDGVTKWQAMERIYQEYLNNVRNNDNGKREIHRIYPIPDAVIDAIPKEYMGDGVKNIVHSALIFHTQRAVTDALRSVYRNNQCTGIGKFIELLKKSLRVDTEQERKKLTPPEEYPNQQPLLFDDEPKHNRVCGGPTDLSFIDPCEGMTRAERREYIDKFIMDRLEVAGQGGKMTYQQVCEALEYAGIKTPRGNDKWAIGSVNTAFRRIMKNREE